MGNRRSSMRAVAGRYDRLSPATQRKSTKKKPPPSGSIRPVPARHPPSRHRRRAARVLREIDGIEQEALAQLRALPPPVLTVSRHPSGTGMRLIQLLGKA